MSLNRTIDQLSLRYKRVNREAAQVLDYSHVKETTNGGFGQAHFTGDGRCRGGGSRSYARVRTN